MIALRKVSVSALSTSAWLSAGIGCIDSISAGFVEPGMCLMEKEYDCSRRPHLRILGDGLPLGL